jgi:hypothetical protein
LGGPAQQVTASGLVTAAAFAIGRILTARRTVASGMRNLQGGQDRD